jgi:30S ribosomal protein S31
MGKGDKKTRRGKLFMKSYGVSRPQKPTKATLKPDAPKAKAEVKAATPKKTTKKKKEE